MGEPTFVLNRPDSSDEAALRERFEKLAAQWRAETRFLSSSTAIAMHPAYQQIIGMGSAALPLILRELEEEPYHWYWALRVRKSITSRFQAGILSTLGRMV